jgi:hypothetical protein
MRDACKVSFRCHAHASQRVYWASRCASAPSSVVRNGSAQRWRPIPAPPAPPTPAPPPPPVACLRRWHVSCVKAGGHNRLRADACLVASATLVDTRAARAAHARAAAAAGDLLASPATRRHTRLSANARNNAGRGRVQRQACLRARTAAPAAPSAAQPPQRRPRRPRRRRPRHRLPGCQRRPGSRPHHQRRRRQRRRLRQ